MTAIRKIKNTNFNKKTNVEREYEQSLVTSLESSRLLKSNIITQVGANEVDKITQSHLFGFNHRPDVSIGNDGTAIELKIVSGSQSVRDLIGQGIVYRMQYRFVILVLIDGTTDSRIVELCSDKSSQEHSILMGMADSLNIFSVVGPKVNNGNVAFFPK